MAEELLLKDLENQKTLNQLYLMYCLKYPVQKENPIIEQILQCIRSKTPNVIESTKIAFSWTEKS